MRLSQKGEYGLHALLELARRYGQGPVQSNLIAGERGIPAQYLQQILLSLRRAGLIRSERGPHGGHELARPPAEITLLAAVEALEGSCAPAECVDPGSRPACPQHERCVLVDIWRQVDGATRTILESVTLAGLARREAELSQAPMYHI
jgi:Rrf2 family transcriptional regulator, cysteine metabolism repressor